MIKYLVIDTETTGLHIISDKPFLFQYGLVDEKLNLIDKQLFDASNPQKKQLFIQYLIDTPTIVGHNIKFDVHMCVNAGIDINLFANKNFIDTAVLARLAIDHDTQADDTFRVGLKPLAIRYLGVDSNVEERVLKMELSKLISDHKAAMKQYFIDQRLWDSTLNQTGQTVVLNKVYNSWTKIYHLYPHLKIPRKTFLQQHPAPTYQDCTNIYTYALTDIKLTYGLLKLWFPKIVPLQQGDTLKRISAAIYPLVLMERQGMSVDVQQVLRDRQAVINEINKTQIIDPRTNKTLSIGQHAKLKELYEFESGQLLKSADKQTRADIEAVSPAAKAANYLAKLDKYLNTYINGVLEKLTYVNGEAKIFTDYNMAGTITGRLSGNFQQFPKDPLILNDGTSINIRSWFIVPKGYKYMFYFDYSQMELRLQCEWTNVINNQPDINLARAFSPYKCISKDGKWYFEEDPTVQWKALDLHAMTAKHAFPDIDETHPDWAHYRSLGKRANFAINYGAAAPKLVEALKVDFTTARALINGYRHTFAGVVAFSKWISKRVYTTDNIPNLLLRRYYSRNKHQLQNWLVQGSGADILLLKLRELYEYIKDKPHWKFMITVHDEVGFACEDIPETQLIKEVAEIQQIMLHKLSAVDIVCDVEYTTTKWSEKKDWEGHVD